MHELEHEEHEQAVSDAAYADMQAQEHNKASTYLMDALLRTESLRDSFESLKARKDALEEEFRKQNEELFGRLSACQEALAVVESEVRDHAIVIYHLSGEKKLAGGVGIRVMEKIEYAPEEALGWAKEHKMALQLDKKAFERIAKAQKGELNFVKFTEEAIATLPAKITLEKE